MKSTCETCGVGNSYIDVVKRLLFIIHFIHETCILPELPIIDIAATFDLCSLNDAILIVSPQLSSFNITSGHVIRFPTFPLPLPFAILTVASTIVVVDIIGSLRLLFATNMYF